MIVWLEIIPKHPSGAPVIRICSAQDRRAQSWDDKKWAAAVTDPGALSITLFNGEIGSDLNVGSTVMALSAQAILDAFPTAQNVRWQSAAYKLWCGKFTAQAGGAYPYPNTAALISQGVIDRFEKDGGAYKVTLSPTSTDKPVLYLEYAGTGGAEGGFDMKGVLKPWIFGHAKNVEPLLIDPDNSVYQFSAYGPIQAVDTLYERGAAFGASVGNYGTYANLVAATIPAGKYATCLAAGMIRLGAPQYGVITGDIKGHYEGSTQRRWPGAIISHIAAKLSVPSTMIDALSLGALDTFAATLPSTGYMNLVLTDQVDLLTLAKRLFNAYNAQAGFDLMNRLIATRVSIGTPSFTINSKGKSLPVVAGFVEADTPAPYKKIVVSGDKSWRSHDIASEVAFAAQIRPAGFYASSETYREGEVVEVGDGSTWLYIATSASSGTAPPTWPSTSNTHWQNLTPPIDSTAVRYSDGTPLEDLKPAEPGATDGAAIDNIKDGNGDPIDPDRLLTENGTAARVEMIGDFTEAEFNQKVLDAESEIAELFSTYGDTESANTARVAAEIAASNALYLDAAYSFSFDAGGVNGFTTINADLSGAVGGATLSSSVDDPRLIRTGLSFAGNRFTRVIIEVTRLTAAPAGSIFEGRMYWTNAGHGWDGNYCASMDKNPPLGVRSTITIDVPTTFSQNLPSNGALTDWTGGTITALRFDFDHPRSGNFKIHSVRVVGADTSAPNNASKISNDQAVIATEKATAAQTALTLISSMGGSNFVPNGGFDDYPSGVVGQLPTGWGAWVGSGNVQRVTGLDGSYSVRIPSTAGNAAGILIQQPAKRLNPNDYVVVEAEFTLDSGTLAGAGVLLSAINAGATAEVEGHQVTFAAIPSSNGPASAGVAGRTYRFQKLLRFVTAEVHGFNIYIQSHWTGHGSITAANSITWHRVGVRAATQAEIAEGVAIPGLQSTVSAQGSTLATHASRLASYLLRTSAGAGTAEVSLQALDSGGAAASSIGLKADRITLGGMTQPALDISGGNARFTGALNVGGTSGARLTINNQMVQVFNSANVNQLKLGIF